MERVIQDAMAPPAGNGTTSLNSVRVSTKGHMPCSSLWMMVYVPHTSTGRPAEDVPASPSVSFDEAFVSEWQQNLPRSRSLTSTHGCTYVKARICHHSCDEVSRSTDNEDAARATGYPQRAPASASSASPCVFARLTITRCGRRRLCVRIAANAPACSRAPRSHAPYVASVWPGHLFCRRGLQTKTQRLFEFAKDAATAIVARRHLPPLPVQCICSFPRPDTVLAPAADAQRLHYRHRARRVCLSVRHPGSCVHPLHKQYGGSRDASMCVWSIRCFPVVALSAEHALQRPGWR
jgi:hypothetical protein